MKKGGPSGSSAAKPGCSGHRTPAEQSDHLEHEDDEAPEHERVHDPRRLLADQELLLAERVDRASSDRLRDPVHVRAAGRARRSSRTLPAMIPANTSIPMVQRIRKTTSLTRALP